MKLALWVYIFSLVFNPIAMGPPILFAIWFGHKIYRRFR
jgi:hypothetical protein